MRLADLFCGYGGLTEGAVQAGHTVEWVANHSHDAIKWHRANHPDVLHYCQDLGEIDWTGVDPVEWVHASPVCQGFTQNGQPARAGTGGNFSPDIDVMRAKTMRDRNTMWMVLSCADTMRPETITVENVCDIYRWNTFAAWRGVLESLGYTVRCHTLNPLDFGGAQDRPRAIVTARLGEAFDLAPGNGQRAATIGECLQDDTDPENRWTLIDSKPERMQTRIAKAQREAGGRCFWANVSESRGRPLDGPFPTATTKSGSQWNLIHGRHIRVLNPREIARSMSFPDHSHIPTTRGLASLLLGNAMDVKVSRAIAEQIH